MDNNQKTKEALVRVYNILKFSSAELKETANNLAVLQRLAVAAALVGNLKESETAQLGKDFAVKSDDEKRKIIEQILSTYSGDKDFIARAEAEAKKVLDEHVAYLKTRGDEAQKEAIGKILAEIG